MEHWMHRPAWVEIDLRVLDNNIKTVQSCIAEGSQMLAVVKGNCYGHGLKECYPVFRANGVSNFAVATLDEAIEHVNRFGTMHSECIVTEDAAAAERFLAEVDAAAVYWNASTRFTDGGQFGLGAEIGISTQKLHARGPFALEALCSYKYVVRGTGQVRA